MAFRFREGTNSVDKPESTNSDSDPHTASANKNSSMGVMLSNISRAPVGVLGKFDEIIRQVSHCSFVSFLPRYFLLRLPAQDTHAYDMIGRIIAMYSVPSKLSPPAKMPEIVRTS